VFTRAPRSTQQILHPETYIEDEKPEDPETPKLEKPREFRLLNDGSVGEFDHSMLLRQYIGEKRRARDGGRLARRFVSPVREQAR